MKALLVEDDQYKTSSIEKYLLDTIPSLELRIARSVSTATRAVRDEIFDLILLDMSLPSFDIGPSEQGGKPQGFGGFDVLRMLDTVGERSNVIVVTQFEMFGEDDEAIDLAGLREQLLVEFPDLVSGVVYFDTTGNRWIKELTLLIQGKAQPK